MNRIFATMLLPVALVCTSPAQRIEVTVPATKLLHGRLILVIAKSDKPEPRMQLSETYDSAEGFGRDAEDLAPGTPLIGPGMPHCYTGGPSEYTMQQNNADWIQRVLPQTVEHMLATAPSGADTKSWRY